MVYIFIVILLVACCPFAQSTRLFWKDESLQAYVFDNLSPKEFPRFRKQFKEVALKFNADALNFSSLGGFKSKFPPSRYKSKYLKRLTKKVKESYPDAGKLSLSAMDEYILERTDFNHIAIQCSSSRSEIVVIVFLNDAWGKNDYGDVALYNDKDEIAMSFHPKRGRAVFMKCGTKYKINPPSIAKEQRLYLRFLEYTRQPTEFLSGDYEGNDIDLNDFLRETTVNRIGELDISKYLTKVIRTSDNKTIHIFDDLLPEDVTQALYTYVTTHATYYEEEIEEHSEDNVRWIIDMQYRNFAESSLWTVFKMAISFISGRSTFHPYDTTCNHIRRTDITKIHLDCLREEKEYTSIVYLNPNWNANLHGETVFLTGNDFLAAVVPKFGRLVVFDGAIGHSARPPSPNINGARYTFAVKTSIDAATARKKKEMIDSQ